MVLQRKVLALCEIDVVHLLSSTHSPKGLLKRSPTKFFRKLQKILCTLHRFEGSDKEVVMSSQTLVSHILEFTEGLVSENPVDAGKINADAEDGSHNIEHPLKSLIDRFSRKRCETPRNLPHVDVSDLYILRSTSKILAQFEKEKKDQFRNVSPYDWDLWISSLKLSEVCWERVSHPTYREAPGFWLVRDLQINLLEDFG